MWPVTAVSHKPELEVLNKDNEDQDHNLQHFTHRSLPPPSSHRLELQYRVNSRDKLRLLQRTCRTKPRRPDEVHTKDERNIYLKSDQSLIDN